MENKLFLSLMSIILAFILSACGTNNANDSDTNTDKNQADNTVESDTGVKNDNNELLDTSNANELSTTKATPVVEGVREAENPVFKTGDTVSINTEHEEGMSGVEGIILGSYDTIVYSVSYNPTNGGQPEENHKWLIHEELQGLDEEMLVPGAAVILEAEYEEGMLGAEGEIDTAEKTTAYKVEFILPTGVQKQKWFKESELTAK